jgi:hypothetical protein
MLVGGLLLFQPLLLWLPWLHTCTALVAVTRCIRHVPLLAVPAIAVGTHPLHAMITS